MKTSSVAPLFLGLWSLGSPCAEALQMAVKEPRSGTTFKISKFDDGRNTPYRVYFWDDALRGSSYRFDDAGDLACIRVGREVYYDIQKNGAAGGSTNTSFARKDVGGRMLFGEGEAGERGGHAHLSQYAEADGTKGSRHRRLDDCTDCEVAWNAVCDTGLPEVCGMVGHPSLGDAGISSLGKMCSGFGSLCSSLSADAACDGQCLDGDTQIQGPGTSPDVVGQTCDNGLPGVSKGIYCCSLGCGAQCGGPGCSNRGPRLDGDDCCTSSIQANGVMCADSNAAPCMGAAATVPMTPAPIDDTSLSGFSCSGDAGVLSGNGKACCPSSCSRCGGEGCGKLGDHCCEGKITASGDYCSVTNTAPCIADGVCDQNPCSFGSNCSVDNHGGHICSCSAGFGGMACQIDTEDLARFYMELEYVGSWTDSQKGVFESAAARWAEVISHVPCGGSSTEPPGRLFISATLEAIDGDGGVLGFAGPTSIWSSCRISLKGIMNFDIDDIRSMEENGTFESIILHEMGHVIGIGTLWDRCSTCLVDGGSEWTCPAVIATYNELLGDPTGTEANVVEVSGEDGTRCVHFSDAVFGNELSTGYATVSGMPLSKLTAAALEDMGYVVDPTAVDAYTLPPAVDLDLDLDLGRGQHNEGGFVLQDSIVAQDIELVGEGGEVVGQAPGIAIETKQPA